jgi:hypothetical protein
MTPVSTGETRRARSLPRFLYSDWLWVGLTSGTDLVIAVLGFTSILMLRPDLIDALGLAIESLPVQAVTTVERHTGLGFLALLPAVWIIMDVIKRLVQRGEGPLDPAQIDIMRRAGLRGWVVDFLGDGVYCLYGPTGERKQVGDLADLEDAVDQLEANNGRHLGRDLQNDH